MSAKTGWPDREAASVLNPLISDVFTEDTLDRVASVITDLGYYLSLVEENIPETGELRFGNLYQLFNVCAAALRYESANVRPLAGFEERPDVQSEGLQACRPYTCR